MMRQFPGSPGIRGISLAVAASCGFLASGAPSAHANTLLQTFSDTYVLNPIPVGTSTAYGPPSTFTVLPFDPSLGSLLTVTITWATSGAGTATASANGGSLSLANGGGTVVNSSTYGGYGTGAGDGAAPNQPFAVTLPDSGLITTFQPPSAGTTDDPAIWAAFTGAGPFTIRYQNPAIPGPYTVSYATVSGSASITTTASVAYNYAPVPGPLALLGAPAAWAWSRRLRTRQRCGRGDRAQRFTCRRPGPHRAGQGPCSG